MSRYPGAGVALVALLVILGALLLDRLGLLEDGPT